MVSHERKTVISKNNKDNIFEKSPLKIKNISRSNLNSSRKNEFNIDDLIQIRHSNNNSQNKDYETNPTSNIQLDSNKYESRLNDNNLIASIISEQSNFMNANNDVSINNQQNENNNQDN